MLQCYLVKVVCYHTKMTKVVVILWHHYVPVQFFCGTVALLSASTVVPMTEQLQGGRIKRDWSQYLVNWSKGGRTKRVWSQYFVNWSKGGRVKPRSSYDARHQTLQYTSQIEYCAVLPQVMRGFEYCKELMSTMKLELGRVSEVEVSRASSIGTTRLRRFTLFVNVLVFK
jgi:hypothetical protein